jgi:hypothetical protein
VDLVSRLNPAVERRWLLLVAGCLWTAVGVMLNVFAVEWLSTAAWAVSLPLAAVGLVAALVIYRFGFLRLALRNISRIGGVKQHICVFAFQAWKSYLIVVVMMALGIALRSSGIPKPDLAPLYMGIGGGLLLSSLHYYRQLLQYPQKYAAVSR